MSVSPFTFYQLLKELHVYALRSYTEQKWKKAAPELFAIYIQTYANQEYKWKCILMFKYWVMHMHNSKSYKDVVTRKHMKAI